MVIENQLERSEQVHLGKLLTYLVLMEAKAAIWIVSEPLATSSGFRVPPSHGHCSEKISHDKYWDLANGTKFRDGRRWFWDTLSGQNYSVLLSSGSSVQVPIGFGNLGNLPNDQATRAPYRKRTPPNPRNL